MRIVIGSLAAMLGCACGSSPPEEIVDAGLPDAAPTDAGPADAEPCRAYDAAPVSSPHDVAYWVAYRGLQDSLDHIELYAASVAGAQAGAVEKLNDPLPPGGDVRVGGVRPPFAWSPDGAKLAYIADQDTVNVGEIYVVDMSGAAPGPALKVNGPLVAGGSVIGLSERLPLAWSPDSTKIAYVADQQVEGVRELFVVDVSGAVPGPSRKASQDFTSLESHVGAGTEPAFRWAPDSRSILYMATETPDQQELFLVDVSGIPGDPVRVNGLLAPGTEVQRYYNWSPTGDALLYASDEEVPSRVLLYIVPVNGTTLGQRVQTIGSGAFRPAFSPNGALVFFVAHPFSGQQGLFVLETDALTAPPRKISGPQTFNDVEFAWSPDSTTLAYRLLGASARELYAVRVLGAGAGEPVRVNGPLVVNGTVHPEFAWSPDSTMLAYRADQDAYERFELYVADMSVWPPLPPVKVNGPLASSPGGGVQADFAWAPDSSRLLYRADQAASGQMEAWVTDVRCAAVGRNDRVNGPLTPDEPDVVGDVERAAWAPDSATVVYAADQDIDTLIELYAVDVRGAAPGAAVVVSGTPVAGGLIIEDFSWAPEPR